MRKFIVKHDWLSWEMEVEIDEAKAAPAIKQMVEFWTGWERALDNNDGDYTKTFLENLACQCLTIAISHNYNATGIIREFEKLEGWCPMDGRQGIKITDVYCYSLDRDEFSVEEVKP